MPAEVADVRVDTRADLAAVRVLPLFGTIVAHRSLRLALTYVAAEIEFGLNGGRAADAATTAAQIGRTASKQLRLELEAIAAIVHIQIILSGVGSTHISVLLCLGAFLCARLGRWRRGGRHQRRGGGIHLANGRQFRNANHGFATSASGYSNDVQLEAASGSCSGSAYSSRWIGCQRCGICLMLALCRNEECLRARLFIEVLMASAAALCSASLCSGLFLRQGIVFKFHRLVIFVQHQLWLHVGCVHCVAVAVVAIYKGKATWLLITVDWGEGGELGRGMQEKGKNTQIMIRAEAKVDSSVKSDRKSYRDFQAIFHFARFEFEKFSSFFFFFYFCFWWRNFNSFCCDFLLQVFGSTFYDFPFAFSWIWLSGFFFLIAHGFLFFTWDNLENIENWKIRCNFQASAINPCELNPIINLFLFTFSSLSLSLFSLVSLLWIFCISLASLLVSQGNSPGAWKTKNAKCRDKETKSLGIFFVYHFSLFLNFSLLSHIIAIFTHKKRTRRVFF